MISHHQAPTGQPGLGIGPHRHVGRGCRCPLRPWRPSCDPTGSSATARNSPPHRSAGRHRRARRDRLRHRCLLNPTSVTVTLTSTARSTSASSSTAAQRQRDRQQGPRASATASRVRRHSARPCHHLYQRRERHDQRQQGLRLPEERDRGHRPDRRWRRPSSVQTSATSRRTSSPARVPSTTSPRTAS